MSFNFNNGSFGQLNLPSQNQPQYHQQVHQTVATVPVVDCRQLYKQIGIEFCKSYYTAYDTNYQSLVYIFKPDSIFTFLEEEIVGFNNLHARVTGHYAVQKFTHDIKTIDSQPLGGKTMLITVTGLLRINDDISPNNPYQPFLESFILQKDDTSQTFYVHNNIFRLLQ